MAYGWQAETWVDWPLLVTGVAVTLALIAYATFHLAGVPLLLTLTEPSGPVRGLILTSSPGLPRRRRDCGVLGSNTEGQLRNVSCQS